LLHLREDGMAPADAILEATRNRLRPIFMSTLTSVFGMMPLVLFPGAGSELYRGLGSVVIGGLSLSAVLTLLLIPPLMSLALGSRATEHETAAQAAPAE
jgi:HAE1 family hydrophobic/amphiphilic exporter-1